MVHINQVEFENFKSFGGIVKVPLEEGFTVVTGPNGSGKSNILDGILFCLGLASSRGMRAERLPDLINTAKVKEGKSCETSVSVKFDIGDWSPREDTKDLDINEDELSFFKEQKEWTVSRKLRLMPGGSYASTYSSDGKSCTLQQIQKLLRDIRVDHEGSNVVMQGDVTRIVSMSNKERRNLIDELAGVALFDSRIEQTHLKLNDVYERQERCEILKNELESNKLKLEKECQKAKKYKAIKEKLNNLNEIKKVFLYEDQLHRLETISKKQVDCENKQNIFKNNLKSVEKEIEVLMNALKVIVADLKEKGEDELIQVNSEIGSINNNLRELERLSELNKNEGLKLKENRDQIAIKKRNIEIDKRNLISFDENKLAELEEEIRNLTNTHKLSRKKLSEAADESGEFSKKNLKINNEIDNLKKYIEPFLNKKRIIEKEILENNTQRDEISSQIKLLTVDKNSLIQLDSKQEIKVKEHNDQLDNIKSKISNCKSEINVLVKTIDRLSYERLKLEKDLSKLESRKETINETRGSFALRILLEAGLDGIHGYVAQLGEVKEKYRYALEIAAGRRLGQIVVDNDFVASKAIDILKRKKAGRLTFLPLNRLKKFNSNFSTARFEMKDSKGYINKAINLINYENIYSDVFHYVFGDTKVFTDLDTAKNIKSKSRIVTLSGELLESTGAITGGSKLNRELIFRFGSNDDIDEISPFKKRLFEINESIKIANNELKNKNLILENLFVNQRKTNELFVSIKKEIDLNQKSMKLSENKIQANLIRLQQLKDKNDLLKNNLDKALNDSLPQQNKLKELEQELIKINENNQNSSLQLINKDFEGVDFELEQLIKKRNLLLEQKNNLALTKEKISNEQQLILLKEKNLIDSIKELAISHQDWIDKKNVLKKELSNLESQKNKLEQNFGLMRRKRDELNSKISNHGQEKNEIVLKIDYLKRDIDSLAEEKRNENIKLQEYKKLLPDPTPDLNEYSYKNIDELQVEILSLNSSLESLEPVNMLALDELAELQERLKALVERLDILSNERSELLLRIETVSTMRQEAFMEAFIEVDKHFREIFAMLSDGDGFLQLENKIAPLEGGLTLVAHPKGKNVRRLASMSGGEKSLTALSFLFALQKYKPSPFYALDEVDSFLDGINVERLSKLITSQSSNAQFIVVSHRRPMINASMRTIGVAQARGSHTQVIGLPNAA